MKKFWDPAVESLGLGGQWQTNLRQDPTFSKTSMPTLKCGRRNVPILGMFRFWICYQMFGFAGETLDYAIVTV